VNRTYDLRRPGRYSVHVSHELPYGPGDGDLTTLRPDGLHQTFDADLEIVLEASSELELKAEFERYLKDLHASDWQRRRDAAEVIANVAPPFLEDTIIQMLDSPGLRPFAVRGLHTLGTPAGHQALVNFVREFPPTSSAGEYQDAIRYLGDIGNRGDIALLLQVAHRNATGSYSQETAIESAGKAGAADAVPLLMAELNDQSIEVQQSAVRALYLTGSRDAVPVLIELLLSPEERLSGTAEFGLQVLTHFTATSPRSALNPAASYSKWIRWWNANRGSTTIFKYDQCGSLAPIE
jgi:HEAT repeat protein